MHTDPIHENPELFASDTFSALDRRFAAFMAELSGGNAAEVLLAAALVSRQREEGHICIDLDAIAGKPLSSSPPSISCPSLKDWLAALRTSLVVGKPGDYRPLILDGNRLYLYRYWDYENRVAARLRRDADWTDPDLNETLLKNGLDRLFPQVMGAAEIDGQKIAAAVCLLKKFSVISGGPGTGKTTTVARILALLLEQAADKSALSASLRIALCAPTGKAAARLQEAISRETGALNCDDRIKAGIPAQASTIHRLLQSVSPGNTDFSAIDFCSSERLPVDVLVIDEASMVDLSLLARLISSLPSGARLILLGDKDQLASVEAGSVLADICGSVGSDFSPVLCERLQALTGASLAAASSTAPPVDDCVVVLQKSYRFGENSGMGAVSRLVNGGDAGGALGILMSGRFDDLRWQALPGMDDLQERLRESVMKGFTPCLQCTDPAEALTALNRFRLLCALREGPYGFRALNAAVEGILSEAGLIRRKTARDHAWYRGRPLLITRNDYTLRLFNGDVGMILDDPETNQLRAFFQDADGGIRKFPPLRLPEHETVYAMTVHKSQGSEFDEVILILPDRPSPVLTRELLYTAVTRARRHMTIWGREEVFSAAVGKRIERESGLHDALRNKSE